LWVYRKSNSKYWWNDIPSIIRDDILRNRFKLNFKYFWRVKYSCCTALFLPSCMWFYYITLDFSSNNFNKGVAVNSYVVFLYFGQILLVILLLFILMQLLVWFRSANIVGIYFCYGYFYALNLCLKRGHLIIIPFSFKRC
jgi:F0F1-type ATP synthase assembly protein I